MPNQLPAPGSPGAPGYWMHEESGRLKGPIMRYLEDQPLSTADIALIRAYLKQWIDSPAWDMDPAADPRSKAELAELRTLAAKIMTRADINAWIGKGLDVGIDPL